MCRQMVNKEKKGQWQQGKDKINKSIKMTILRLKVNWLSAEILAFCGSSFFSHFVAILLLLTTEGKVVADILRSASDS